MRKTEYLTLVNMTAEISRNILPYEIKKILSSQEYTCKNCGKKFLTDNHNKTTFCSGKCYHEYKSRKDEK